MEASSLGCDLGFSQLLVCESKISLAVGPGFVGDGVVSPIMTGISKESSMKDKVVCIGNNVV